ncbi:OmpA family protein [Pontibacter sp. SGAir0037]|uniref:OmpA family protein n=1 Tax=Pontibacter sp. SGAir0037 TaxID=2571030 RepID=UPI0010CD4949|nr:OmpA family protein [Pontibacter sp. SGAir0037]QCR23924.1 hypothetical protein C1N53_17255 [Pontibacter sp. SGAir0037]
MKKLSSLTLIASIGLLYACNSPEGGVERDSLADATADTAVMYGDESGRIEAEGVEVKKVDESFWSNIDRNAPVKNDQRLQGTGVEARGTDEYTIYSMDENILFDVDKATLRSGAEDKLSSISASIQDMGNAGQIRVYGHTDSTASKSYNKQLAEDRAKTVKDWLNNKGDIDKSRISVEAVGESNPVATNATPEGRQKNRRVEIVVVNGQ